VPQGARARRVNIPAYALYYVCEGVNGVCISGRQDVELQVAVESGGFRRGETF